MRADAGHQEADYAEAIAVGEAAVSGIWSNMNSTPASGGHYHLAQAHRDFGEWLETKGRLADAKSHLEDALGIFLDCEQSYLNLRDAPHGDHGEALQAATDAVKGTAEQLNELIERISARRMLPTPTARGATIA